MLLSQIRYCTKITGALREAELIVVLPHIHVLPNIINVFFKFSS